MDDLPPFQDYWTYMYKKKTMNVVSRKSGARLMGLAKAWEELFNPTIETYKLCQARVIQLAKVFADVVLVEFRDKKKATWRNLDVSDSDICFKNCKDCFDKMLFGHKAVNDDSDRGHWE